MKDRKKKVMEVITTACEALDALGMEYVVIYGNAAEDWGQVAIPTDMAPQRASALMKVGFSYVIGQTIPTPKVAN